MSFDHYYQSELTALRQLGRRFAERSPALAPYLGQAGQDPDVERLLEGFAFLTGRLRQRLDDELPELSHSLMHLLWPNYVRPIPAFSILQFDPLTQAGPALKVEPDTPVESTPIGGVRCQFRVCYPTDVQALEATALSYSVNGDGATLSLRLSVSGDDHIGRLALSRLRLHLAGERYISQGLYLNLLQNLASVEVVPLDAYGTTLFDQKGKPFALNLGRDVVKPVGFAEAEALMPYPLNTFRGYRYLQEYFAFQDKFLFVDINGLGVLDMLDDAVMQQTRGIDIRFHIRKSGMLHIRPTLENVKLHCTPIVNLFKHDAIPIRLDGRQDEYRLLPAEYDQNQCAIFCIETVTGWQPGGMGYQNYVPFESFEHDASFDTPYCSPHYSIRQRPSMLHQGLDSYLSFGAQRHDLHETLSVELMCTNHNLPSKLATGAICQPCDGTPEFLRFRNIIPPTASYPPPLTQDFLWKVVSNMSLNYLSLADINALKVILETYDFPRYYDQKAEKISNRLLCGLKSIEHQYVDRLYQGLPVRGVRTDLVIDPQGYVGEGDLYLFACILNEFFALYASLNSFHELQVKSTQGEVYQWAPRMGLQPLL